MKTPIPTLATLVILLPACSSAHFSDANKRIQITNSGCIPSSSKDCPAPTVEEATPLLTTLQSHEAVFAVRNLSCALCHSKVDANIISDFARSSDELSADQSVRNLLQLTTAGITPDNKAFIDQYPPEIAGKFIVPAGDISLDTKYIGQDKSVDCDQVQPSQSQSLGKTSLIDAVKKCLEPKIKWGSGSEKFVAKDKVEINPISNPADIKALAAADVLSSKGMSPIGGATIDGITGDATSGFKAGATVNCEGAVIFDGPVLLQNTLINTQRGCRIYSTASIFLFDAVTVAGPAETANLQLLSSRYVGFDMPVTGQCRADWTNCTSGDGILQWRLVTYGGLRAQTFSNGTGAEVYSAVKADGARLGINTLVGSGNKDYARIAAAAPVAYSRSSGKFSGVIIAEQFLGKIGSLSFSFDPVFKAGINTPALFPEIKNAMVVVK